jgi:quercetin dioxygenase-like cupin family protein
MLVTSGMYTSLVTDLIECNFFSSPGYQIVEHLHPYYQLDILLEENLIVLLEGLPPLQARRGDAWLIPPLLRHSFRATEHSRLATFKFQLIPSF